MASFSSQSVARLNGGWSNNPKLGPRLTRGGKRVGGFGGRGDLEETRRYRDAPGRDQDGYDMVFDVPRGKRRREKSRSMSPERHRERSSDRRHGRRSRSRDNDREHGREGDRRSGHDRGRERYERRR